MDGLIPLSAAQRAVADKVGAMASTPAWNSKRPLTPEATDGEQATGQETLQRVSSTTRACQDVGGIPDGHVSTRRVLLEYRPLRFGHQP